MMIAAKINLSAVDQSRLFPGKNGAKYLDVILIETPNDKFGNSHMVVQSVSKEEREAGKRGPILGNAKTIGVGSRSAERTSGRVKGPHDDSVPF